MTNPFTLKSWPPYVVGAAIGVLGMLGEAGRFVALFPVLQPLVKGVGEMGKITVPETLGVSPWMIIGALLAAGVIALMLIGQGKYGGAGWSLPQRPGGKQPKASA